MKHNSRNQGSLLFYVLFSLIFSFCGVWILVGWRYATEHSSRLKGVAIILLSFLFFLAYFSFILLLPVPYHVVLIIHVIFMIAGGISGYKALGKTLAASNNHYSEQSNSEDASSIEKSPSPFFDLLLFAAVFYFIGCCYFGFGGIYILPNSENITHKGLTPHYSLIYGLLFIIPGIIMYVVFSRRVSKISIVHIANMFAAFTTTLISFGILFVCMFSLIENFSRSAAYSLGSDIADNTYISDVIFIIAFAGFCAFIAESINLKTFFLRNLIVVPFMLLMSMSALPISGHMENALYSRANIFSYSSSAPYSSYATFLYTRCLKRFPDNDLAAEMTYKLANQMISEKNIAGASRTMNDLISRYGDDPKHYYYVNKSKNILESIKSAKDSLSIGKGVTRIDVPVIRPESYTDDDWLALLSAIRFWEHKSKDSDFLIKLRDISTSSDEIKLPDLRYFNDLKAYAGMLGYGTFGFSGYQNSIKTILSEGYPALIPAYQENLYYKDDISMNSNFLNYRLLIAYEYDEYLGIIKFYNYNQYDEEKNKDISDDDIKDILFPANESTGEQYYSRLKKEITLELSLKEVEELLWENANVMFVVFPEKERELVTKKLNALGFSSQSEEGWIYHFSAGELMYDYGDLEKALSEMLISANETIDTSFPSHFAAVIAMSMKENENKYYNALERISGENKNGYGHERIFESPEAKSAVAHLYEDIKNETVHHNILHSLLTLKDYALSGDDTLRNKLLSSLTKKYPYNVDYQKRLAAYYKEKNDIVSLEEVYKNIALLHPDEDQHKVDYARTLIDNNKYELAAEQLKETYWKYRKEDSESNYVYGRIHLHKKQYAKAAKLFKFAIKIDPYDAEYHYHLGRTLLKLKKPLEAKQELEWALKISPGAPIASDVKDLLKEI